MNGTEVTHAIRADNPHLPIVLASGYSDKAAIEAATGPATTLLRKPFRIDDLQAVLANALAGWGEDKVQGEVEGAANPTQTKSGCISPD